MKGLSKTSSGMTDELDGPRPPAGRSHTCSCFRQPSGRHGAALCWLHGISAGHITSQPLPLSGAVTTKGTVSQVWEDCPCPLGLQLDFRWCAHLSFLFPFARKSTSECLLVLHKSTSVKDFSQCSACLGQSTLLWKNLCALSIVMVQPSQDGEGEDVATCLLCWQGSSYLLRILLLDALIRSCLVEVGDIRMEDA